MDLMIICVCISFDCSDQCNTFMLIEIKPTEDAIAN